MAPPLDPPPLAHSAPRQHRHEQPYQQDGDVPASEHRWAHLRNQVAYRCKRMNSGHTVEAYQRYGQRDAISPHAMALFFRSDAPAEPHGYQLLTATRLWLDSPESDDLPRLLSELAEVATDNIARAASAGRQWHPLGPDGSMVNGGDMRPSHGATYVGVGVSTLDSDQGRWHQVANTLLGKEAPGVHRSPFDLKGQCYALLTDGTALHIRRDPHARLGDDGIRCNKTLDPSRAAYYYYNPHERLTEQGDDDTREVWRRLAALHHVLAAHLGVGRPA
ncbi:hypothetical protein OHQ88_33460 (plasmid) [Micromonospora zamorensis]|uniref:hypothetical protein n=1 Tax=Micromonospora zamorensis TaxID=709883 RepID=UPI002E1AFD98